MHDSRPATPSEPRPQMDAATPNPAVSPLQWVVLSQSILLLFVASYVFFRENVVDTEAGLSINKRAWEASYTERDLSIPPGGPREGYWGSKLWTQTYDPDVIWRLTEQEIPGLVSIDANGFQHARAKGGEPVKLMILGGSVAFGAYASDEAHTYYSRFRDLLAERGIPVDVTVVATGAWKTVQSVAALEKHYDAVKPDVVVFFNGLNTLTVGLSADTLHGQSVETGFGQAVVSGQEVQDYDARAEKYITMMTRAEEFSRSRGSLLAIILQPAPFEKRTRSPLEMEIARLYRTMFGPERNLKAGYQVMREAMDELTRTDHDAHFLDLSRVFDGETKTTFADMWHFSDPGHEIVAREMADFFEPILRNKLAEKQSAIPR